MIAQPQRPAAMQRPDYRIGQICERTGLSARQVRAWERRGVVATRRGTGNQRVFGEAELGRLIDAKRMRDAGLGLAEIKLALAITHGSALGAEVDGVRAVQQILSRIGVLLAVAEELSEATRQRLLRRHLVPSQQP